MSGLVLSLRPNERFLVNGAMLQNGEKRSQIRIVDENVNILRMSDVILPDAATTPIKRVYYSTQLILSGDAQETDSKEDIVKALDVLVQVFEGTKLEKNVGRALRAAMLGRYYSILCALKPMFEIEAKMLAMSTNADNDIVSAAPVAASSESETLAIAG